MTRLRWKTALRFFPLCLLGVVLWREKPWTVQFSATAPWAIAASILLNFAVFLPLKAARWLALATRQARRLLIGWATEIGATVSVDAAANLWLRLEGTDPRAAAVVTAATWTPSPTAAGSTGSTA